MVFEDLRPKFRRNTELPSSGSMSKLSMKHVSAIFLFRFFYTEAGCDMFLRYFGISQNYTAL
jgi:hypothetical protein